MNQLSESGSEQLLSSSSSSSSSSSLPPTPPIISPSFCDKAPGPLFKAFIFVFLTALFPLAIILQWPEFLPLAIVLIFSGAGFIVLLLSPLLSALIDAPQPPACHSPFLDDPSPQFTKKIIIRNVFVLANPASGGYSPQIVSNLTNRLKQANINYALNATNGVGSARQVAMSASLSEYDCVALIGGDGTYHEFINGMMNRDDRLIIPVAFIPTGTGNSLCLDLGGLTPSQSIDRLMNGQVTYIDINQITSLPSASSVPSVYSPLNVYSVNEIALGLIGDAAVLAEKWYVRWTRGWRYDLMGLWLVMKKVAYSFAVSYSTSTETVNLPQSSYSTICILNTQHFGKALRVCPDAYLNDGLLDFCLVKETSSGDLLRMFHLLHSGSHVIGSGGKVEMIQCKQIRIGSAKRNAANLGVLSVDGEIVGYEGGILVTCLERKLPILCEINCLSAQERTKQQRTSLT